MTFDDMMLSMGWARRPSPYTGELLYSTGGASGLIINSQSTYYDPVTAEASSVYSNWAAWTPDGGDPQSGGILHVGRTGPGTAGPTERDWSLYLSTPPFVVGDIVYLPPEFSPANMGALPVPYDENAGTLGDLLQLAGIAAAIVGAYGVVGAASSFIESSALDAGAFSQADIAAVSAFEDSTVTASAVSDTVVTGSSAMDEFAFTDYADVADYDIGTNFDVTSSFDVAPESVAPESVAPESVVDTTAIDDQIISQTPVDFDPPGDIWPQGDTTGIDDIIRAQTDAAATEAGYGLPAYSDDSGVLMRDFAASTLPVGTAPSALDKLIKIGTQIFRPAPTRTAPQARYPVSLPPGGRIVTLPGGAQIIVDAIGRPINGAGQVLSMDRRSVQLPSGRHVSLTSTGVLPANAGAGSSSAFILAGLAALAVVAVARH